MTLIEQLISEKIAKNSWHAENMLTALECDPVTMTDEQALGRCRLYHAWKQSGEQKKVARLNAIAGKPAPAMFEGIEK